MRISFAFIYRLSCTIHLSVISMLAVRRILNRMCFVSYTFCILNCKLQRSWSTERNIFDHIETSFPSPDCFKYVIRDTLLWNHPRHTAGGGWILRRLEEVYAAAVRFSAVRLSEMERLEMRWGTHGLTSATAIFDLSKSAAAQGEDTAPRKGSYNACYT